MASIFQKMFTGSAPTEVAPGLYRIKTAYVNAYLIGEPGGPWVLLDTGMPFSADQIKMAVDNLYGVQARPEAIVLTHGHFDHSGSLEELSRYWDVPVYAHPMEIPYLTGQSAYPPADPTVGGFGGQLSRFYTNEPCNVSERIHQLPQDGTVPGLSDWKWLHTPGHTPGHVSLFREKDAVLIAGDAIISMNMRDVGEFMSGKPELNPPPEYFTPDWASSLTSIDKLASLRPAILATGHGEPLYYRGLELDLIDFADRCRPPRDGRYVGAPPHYDANGVVSLPPPANDPLPKIIAGAAAGILAAITTIGILKNRKNPGDSRQSRNETRAVSPVTIRERRGRGRVELAEERRERVPLSERRAAKRRGEAEDKERRIIFKSSRNRNPEEAEPKGTWRIFSYKKERR